MPANYICPRCGYSSSKTSNIKNHFSRKFPCLPKHLDIDITNDIILTILANHVYQPAIKLTSRIDQLLDLSTDKNSEARTTVVNIQNNVNQINQVNRNTYINDHSALIKNYNFNQNIVIKMDTIDKFNCVLDYQNKQRLGITDRLETHFERQINFMKDQNNHFDHTLNKDALLECVNIATSIHACPENHNIEYDKTSKKIKIYNDDEWISYLEGSGVNRVIELLRLNYLDDYECYLLKKIHDIKCRLKRIMIERLDVYYKFLCAFEMAPYCEEKTDTEIIGFQVKEYQSYWVQDYAMKSYISMKKTIKQSEKRELRNTVLNVIKSNTKSNIKEIDEILIKLLNIDMEFKDYLVPKVLQSSDSKVVTIESGMKEIEQTEKKLVILVPKIEQSKEKLLTGEQREKETEQFKEELVPCEQREKLVTSEQ